MSSSNQAQAPNSDPINRDIRFLFWRLAHDGPKHEWSDGKFGGPGAYYLIADGLATCSLPTCDHWLIFLKSKLGSKAFGDFVGFSYSTYGHNYARSNTSISFEPDPVSGLTNRYLTENGTSVVCVTFSLAGPLFILGIAMACANTRQGGAVQDSPTRELILVQPALKVRNKIVKAVRKHIEQRKQDKKPVAVPASLQSIMYHQKVFEDRILEALRLIRECDIPVTMLYWDRDAFLEYSKNFRDTASAMGVACKPVRIKRDPKLGPFQMHIQVARSDEIANALTELLHTF